MKINETGLFLFSDHSLPSFFFFFFLCLELGTGKDLILKLSEKCGQFMCVSGGWGVGRRGFYVYMLQARKKLAIWADSSLLRESVMNNGYIYLSGLAFASSHDLFRAP